MSHGQPDSAMREVANRYPGELSAAQAWGLLSHSLEGAAPLAVGGTCTVDPLVPLLAAECASRGLLVNPTLLPYNSLFQEMLSASGELTGATYALLLPRLQDLVRDPAWPAADCLDVADRLVAALATFSDHASTRLWLASFPPPSALISTGAHGKTVPRAWHAANARLAEGVEALGSVQLLDTNAALSNAGAGAYSAKSWFLGRQPYSPAGMQAIAGAASRAICSAARPAKKILSLDCDGVLWGGVVGEDGWQGIQIGDTPVGRAHAELQQWSLGLVESGVVLALCSRNREEDVWEVFDRQEEMVLRREHVTVAALNWDPKSDNLRQIAEQVGVGVDSIVHVDDDAAVIAEIKANLPDATALLLPRDVSQIPEFVAAQEVFDTDRVTGVDRRRGELLRIEARRSEHTARLSPEEFLADLKLQVEVREVDRSTSARVVQLLQRTNQFNLTTRRHHDGAMAQLLARPGWVCHTFSVTDRFGDYGLTAVAIAGPDDGVLQVDSLLLSCRVIGRGVEQAVMAVLVEQAKELGLPSIRAQFVPTERNEPAANYLERMNFRQLDDVEWELRDVDEAPGWPSYIKRLDRAKVRASG